MTLTNGRFLRLYKVSTNTQYYLPAFVHNTGRIVWLRPGHEITNQAESAPYKQDPDYREVDCKNRFQVRALRDGNLKHFFISEVHFVGLFLDSMKFIIKTGN